jgi:hypothetical protein
VVTGDLDTYLPRPRSGADEPYVDAVSVAAGLSPDAAHLAFVP